MATSEFNELSGAYRGEIGGMGEQHHPFAFRRVIGKANHAVRRLPLNFRRRLIDPRDPGNSRFCTHKISSPSLHLKMKNPPGAAGWVEKLARVPGQQSSRIGWQQQEQGPTRKLILMVRFQKLYRDSSKLGNLFIFLPAETGFFVREPAHKLPRSQQSPRFQPPLHARRPRRPLILSRPWLYYGCHDRQPPATASLRLDGRLHGSSS